MKTLISAKSDSSTGRTSNPTLPSPFRTGLWLSLAAAAYVCFAPAAASAANLFVQCVAIAQTSPNQYNATYNFYVQGLAPNTNYIIVVEHSTSGRPSVKKAIRTDAQGGGFIEFMTGTAYAGQSFTEKFDFYDVYGRYLGALNSVVLMPAPASTSPPASIPRAVQPVVQPVQPAANANGRVVNNRVVWPVFAGNYFDGERIVVTGGANQYAARFPNGNTWKITILGLRNDGTGHYFDVRALDIKTGRYYDGGLAVSKGDGVCYQVAWGSGLNGWQRAQ